MTKPCAHIEPLLSTLLARGAAVAREETGWSKVKLVVVLTKGLKPVTAEAAAKESGLKFWRNVDTHYSVEFGLVCEEHAHGLSWPQNAATL